MSRKALVGFLGTFREASELPRAFGAIGAVIRLLRLRFQANGLPFCSRRLGNGAGGGPGLEMTFYDVSRGPTFENGAFCKNFGGPTYF